MVKQEERKIMSILTKLIPSLLPTILKAAFTKENATNPSTAVAVVVGGMGLYQYTTTGDALESGILVLASIVCFFIRRYTGAK